MTLRGILILLAVVALAAPARSESSWVDTPLFTVQALPPCGDPLDAVQQVALLYGVDWTTRMANVTVHATAPGLTDSTNCSNVSFSFVDDAVSASSPYVSAAALAFYLSTLESYVLAQILFFRFIAVSGNVAPFPEPNPSPLPTPMPFNEGTVTFCATTTNATVSPTSFAAGLARFLDVLDTQVQVLNASVAESGAWNICFELQDSVERPARRSTAALLEFSGTEVLAIATGIVVLTSSVPLASIVQADPFVLAANATSVMVAFDTNVLPAHANDVMSPIVDVDRMWVQQGAAGRGGRSAVVIALPPEAVTTQQLACLVAIQEDGVDNSPSPTASSGVIVWLLITIVVLSVVGISIVWVLTAKESRASEKTLLRGNQEA